MRAYIYWIIQYILCHISILMWEIPHRFLQESSIYLWLYSCLLNLGRFFSFLIFYTVCRTPWTGDQPVARLLPTRRTTHTQNKRTKTSMPWVVFEPTIPAFERPKTVHALDRAATVIGTQESSKWLKYYLGRIRAYIHICTHTYTLDDARARGIHC
jgi:hypothetical protein